MKKVLVAGATGYLGQYVVRAVYLPKYQAGLAGVVLSSPAVKAPGKITARLQVEIFEAMAQCCRHGQKNYVAGFDSAGWRRPAG